MSICLEHSISVFDLIQTILSIDIIRICTRFSLRGMVLNNVLLYFLSLFFRFFEISR